MTNKGEGVRPLTFAKDGGGPEGAVVGAGTTRVQVQGEAALPLQRTVEVQRVLRSEPGQPEYRSKGEQPYRYLCQEQWRSRGFCGRSWDSRSPGPRWSSLTFAKNSGGPEGAAVGAGTAGVQVQGGAGGGLAVAGGVMMLMGGLPYGRGRRLLENNR